MGSMRIALTAVGIGLTLLGTVAAVPGLLSARRQASSAVEVDSALAAMSPASMAHVLGVHDAARRRKDATIGLLGIAAMVVGAVLLALA
jgi:hypothetical protein